MNVSIRRQGITIKTVPVQGDRARIGSGAECEIQLNDPFLAPVVAELVKRGAEWHVVDSGTSLAGVTKAGVRIVDEPVEPDEPYVVGAFELVTDANIARRSVSRVSAAPPQDYIPMTMVESSARDFPHTVVESAMPRGGGAPGAAKGAGAGGKIVFSPVSAAASAGAVPQAQTRSAGLSDVQKRRILLVSLVALATLVLSVAYIVSENRKQAPVPAAVAAKPITATASPAAPPAPLLNGDELARKLDVERAFAAWEAQVAAQPAGSAELRRKIADGAFELARAYAAENDTTNAKRYFEKVVLHGVADSEQVRYARARLR
jgi:hypothetical protein